MLAGPIPLRREHIARLLLTLPHQEVPVVLQQLLHLQPGDGTVVPVLLLQRTVLLLHQAAGWRYLEARGEKKWTLSIKQPGATVGELQGELCGSVPSESNLRDTTELESRRCSHTNKSCWHILLEVQAIKQSKGYLQNMVFSCMCMISLTGWLTAGPFPVCKAVSCVIAACMPAPVFQGGKKKSDECREPTKQYISFFFFAFADLSKYRDAFSSKPTWRKNRLPTRLFHRFFALCHSGQNKINLLLCGENNRWCIWSEVQKVEEQRGKVSIDSKAFFFPFLFFSLQLAKNVWWRKCKGEGLE